MGVAAELRTSNIFIVDEAQPPLEPSRPKITLNLLLGVLMGAMGGVALAFFFEYLDKTVSRPEDIERYVHLPTLGIVPDFSIAGKESEPSLRDVIEGNGSTNGAEPHSDASVPSHSPLSLGCGVLSFPTNIDFTFPGAKSPRGFSFLPVDGAGKGKQPLSSTQRLSLRRWKPRSW